MERPLKHEQGFTLVEILIVVGILGLVMGAIYSIYSAHQKTAFSQAEVVDVQQNLRVAMDTISRDMAEAGILIPAGPNQIFAASAGSPAFPTYTTNVRINMASAEGRFARIAANTDSHALSPGNYTMTTENTFTVEAPATATSPNIVDGFANGDKVRIVRPVSALQPLTGTPLLTVNGDPNRGSFGTTSPTMTLTGMSTSGDIINPGDMIVKVGTDGTFPMSVDYFLVNGGVTVNGYTCPSNQKCLVRQVNGNIATADIVATELSSLRFGYLNDSYTEEASPSDLTKVRAVRVTLVGATARTAAMTGGAAKSRALTTIIKLRNRR